MVLRIKNFLKDFINNFLDLIYKRKCVNCFCTIQKGILCKSCSKTVQNLPSFAHSIINGYKVYSAFYYEGAIKNLIHSLKFKHNKACAYYAAEYLYEYIKTIKDEDFKNAIIVPVLTHKKNYNKRGYDNVLEIGERLAFISGLRINKTALRRVKYTPPQYKLNQKQRKTNVLGAFELNKNFKPDSTVILLDDIMTTGSTLEVITSLFKENGIQNMVCLTLSKTRIDKKGFKHKSTDF